MHRARAAGVAAVLVPGVERGTWARLRALAGVHGWSYAVGTHPHALAGERGEKELAAAVPGPGDLVGACAVGECGLDGAVPVPMEVQEALLAGHLALAREAGLPVILHCWRAHHRMLPILRRFGPLRGVMHSYSGGADLVGAYVALGLHVSFAAAVTRAGARRPVEAMLRVPGERLLAETDAPDQAPAGGTRRGEPAGLAVVVAAMSARRGADVAALTAQNARALFGIGSPGAP